MSDLPLSRDASVVDLLDRLLHKGVVLSGDVVISVAGVDLIYLGLRVLLSSVETAERFGAAVPTDAALRAEPRGDALAATPAERDALGSSPTGRTGRESGSPALDADALDASATDKDLRDPARQPDAGGIDPKHAGEADPPERGQP